ncbi:helix-turn-helix transcriptional regulator [Cytobacillus sp. FSL W8-0315]|uniref:helix-turn-helix domain-containing protein n=1 Tax=Cytobacillus sp. FSL W8-0315 TaxID=2921600 RepID=UPI0002EBD655
MNSTSITNPKTEAITHSIRNMKENFYDDSLDLTRIAESANLSPWHFNRVFKQMVGIPPKKYLMALRLIESKKLLLESDWTSTDICFEVGYNSLGTFTSKFSKEVAVSPNNFRKKKDNKSSSFEGISYGEGRYGSVQGQIIVPENFSGTIFLGAFTSALPSGIPSSCCVINTDSNTEFLLQDLPIGNYYIFAAGFNHQVLADSVLASQNFLRAGYFKSIQITKKQKISLEYGLELRSEQETDPPLLASLPHIYEKIIEIMKDSNFEETKVLSS